MLAIPEAKGKPWLMLGLALAVLMSLWTLIRLIRQEYFAALPLYGLTAFLLPAVLTCIAGWVLPARIARGFVVTALLGFAVFVVGPAAVIAVSLMSLAALSFGGLMGRVGGLSGEGLLPALLELALGLSALVLLLTVAGHFPVNRPFVYASALLAFTVFGWKGLRVRVAALGSWFNDPDPVPFKTWLGASLLIGSVALNICYASLIGFTPDTLVMHLYVASYTETFSQWSYDFHKYVSALEPMGSDLLFGVAYQLSDTLGAQLLNAACSVSTAGLLYSVCRRRIQTFDALLAAAAWLCISYILYLSGSLHAEGLLTLLLFAAFIHLESLGDGETQAWRAGLVAGLFSAAALSVKMLALIMAPAFALLVLLTLAPRRGRVWTTKFLTIAAVVVIVGGGLQYAYAYVETGNPVFFFYNGVFHSPYFQPINFVDDHWTGQYGWNLPFGLTFNTQHYSETGAGSAGLQWFMLLPSALLCLPLRDSVQARRYGFAGLWFAAVVLAPEQYLRYLLPALPFLAVLLAELGAQPGRLPKMLHRTCMLAALGFNLTAMQSALLRFSDLPAEQVFRKDTRSAYLLQEAPEVAANLLINSLEKQPVNVLYISHAWGAELRGTAYYQNWYNPALNVAFTHLNDPEDLGPILTANHIRYIVLNPDFKHTIKADEALAYCRAHCEKVANLGSATLYRVSGTLP
ncbi:MAG: glycosyltransferase family 39 protein [Bacillota bacterium]